MIPRRALFSLALLVLALHALVLGAASAHSTGPAPEAAPQAFETRTIALAAPAPAVAATPPATRPKAAVPAHTAPAPKRPKAQPLTGNAALASQAMPSAGPAPSASWAMPSPSELLALNAVDGFPTNAPEPPPPDSATPTVAQSPTSTRLADAGAAVAQAASAGTPSQAVPIPTPAVAHPPVQLPPSTRLDFEVTGSAKGFGYNASAELLWQHDATSYRAYQEIKVLFLGSRSQESVGSVTAFGLQPKRFGDRARSERAAHFDFANGRVTFSANTPAASIEPGAQDRLSVFLQLASMLAGAPERYPSGTHIEMTTVSARAADVWTFTVQGEETLELPAGTLRAVQLQRLPRREHDQKAQVWLAPSLGYLPARIRLTEPNGDFAELNLRGHEAP